jgi:undecaprenyl-diphosphatase
MSELEALLLGIVQGLTEFLPISSSGHLILVPWLQQYDFLQTHESFNKTFDVALHAGTLLAVLSYFRVEIVRILVGLWRSIRARAVEGTDQRLAWAIVVATIPAVIAGGLGESFIEDHLGEPWQIAIRACGSASPRCCPWHRECHAPGSRSPPAASWGSIATRRRDFPSCSWRP